MNRLSLGLSTCMGVSKKGGPSGTLGIGIGITRKLSGSFRDSLGFFFKENPSLGSTKGV